MNTIAPLINHCSLDQLEQDLISLSSHMNAHEYEFLVKLREFDLRQGWKAYLFDNCATRWPRALSRISTPTTEEHLLDFALMATASQVDRHCMELRNVQCGTSTADANRAHNARYLSCSPHGDGSVTLSVELPQETAGLVMKALESATSCSDSDELRENDVDTPRGASFVAEEASESRPGLSVPRLHT